jgi:hypothetical protein
VPLPELKCASRSSLLLALLLPLALVGLLLLDIYVLLLSVAVGVVPRVLAGTSVVSCGKLATAAARALYSCAQSNTSRARHK